MNQNMSVCIAPICFGVARANIVNRSCCLLAQSLSVSVSQSSMDSLSNRLGAPSMTHSHIHRGCGPRPYPYVIGMRVNMEDYSYQLSTKWRLAGMLELITVCEKVSVHPSLLVLQQSGGYPETAPAGVHVGSGSGNDGAIWTHFAWRAEATQWQITLHCGQWT